MNKMPNAAAEVKVPTDLKQSLEANPEALALWLDITPIARRDWISWIDSAKQPATRERRIEQTSSKLLAGKRRPCCYALVPMDLYKALGANPKAKSGWSSLSPDERRDFVEWVEASTDKDQHKLRIEQ